VITLAGRFLGWLNPRQLAKFLLLFLFLFIVLSGVAQELDRADISLFQNAAFLGLAFGWLIASIPLPAWAASFACGTVGVETALFLAGRLDLPLSGLLQSSGSIVSSILQEKAVSPEMASSWLAAGARLLQTPVAESIRLKTWLVYLANGIPSFDPLASGLIWGLLFFLISVFAGWTVGTRQPMLPAILPGAMCLGLVLVYSQGEWSYAVAALAVILVLLVFGEYDRKEHGWIRSGLGFASEIKMDLVFATIVVVPALLAAAVILPSISLDDISRWIRERFAQPAESLQAGPESLGLQPGSSLSTGIVSAGMPRSHLLKGGLELSREVMMVIVTGEPPVFLPGLPVPVPILHYWRGATYDTYNGRGWSSSPISEQSFESGERVIELPPGGRVLHQEVTSNRDGEGPLYLAGELITVDKAFQVEWRTDQDYFGATVVSPDYQVDSVIPVAGEAELRAAGADYPALIRSRYLHLPSYLPPPITALAVSLTTSSVTPYDQALAIQNYLRQEYKYSLDIQAPPPGRDVVEYFLFDSRTGYCDYFASAMVLLARAAGIPARLASGYAPGTYNLSRLQFVVIEADAHSWPELYFPGIGWVEFEPTTSMSPISRSNAPAPASAEGILRGNSPSTGSLSEAVKAVFNFVIMLPLVALAVAAGFVLWIFLAPFRFFWMRPSAALRTQYRGLRDHSRRLRIPLTPANTPMEVARRLTERCGPKLKDSQILLIRRIATDYTRMVYGNHPPTVGEHKDRAGGWLRLDRGLWGLCIRNGLRFFRRSRRRPTLPDSTRM
jgi:transglutaminase-like putative cysteine protease